MSFPIPNRPCLTFEYPSTIVFFSILCLSCQHLRPLRGGKDEGASHCNTNCHISFLTFQRSEADVLLLFALATHTQAHTHTREKRERDGVYVVSGCKHAFLVSPRTVTCTRILLAKTYYPPPKGYLIQTHLGSHNSKPLQDCTE